jgi:hypothetical protein
MRGTEWIPNPAERFRKEYMIDLMQEPHLIKDDILSLPTAEQDYQIALWISTRAILVDMRKRPEPTPPHRVVEYERFTPSVKSSMNKNPGDYKGYWNDPEIEAYYDQRQTIRNLNWRNLQWLEWARSKLLDNPEAFERLTSFINDFKYTEQKESIRPAVRPTPNYQDRPDRAWEE